jgi:hypothetical protein
MFQEGFQYFSGTMPEDSAFARNLREVYRKRRNDFLERAKFYRK